MRPAKDEGWGAGGTGSKGEERWDRGPGTMGMGSDWEGNQGWGASGGQSSERYRSNRKYTGAEPKGEGKRMRKWHATTRYDPEADQDGVHMSASWACKDYWTKPDVETSRRLRDAGYGRPSGWRAEPQSRSLATCLVKRTVAEIRVYAIGTGNPWGFKQPSPMEFDPTRDMDALLKNPYVNQSLLQKVCDVYDPTRVLSIDCRALGFINDWRQRGQKGHIGTNDLLIKQVVQMVVPLNKLFVVFWKAVRNMSVESLELPMGLALVCWDEYGKHKSPAVASIFYYCLYRDGWKLHTVTGEEVTLLSSPLWYKGSCGKAIEFGGEACDGCDKDIWNRATTSLGDAYVIWEECRDRFLMYVDQRMT